jgi:hypothetical protein
MTNFLTIQVHTGRPLCEPCRRIGVQALRGGRLNMHASRAGAMHTDDGGSPVRALGAFRLVRGCGYSRDLAPVGLRESHIATFRN